jgi:Flp pilus assembly secretin CpaC
MKNKLVFVLGVLRILLALFFAGVASGNADEDPERPPLLLVLGEQRILKAQGFKRYSVGGTAIRATGLPNSDEGLLIKGVSAGFADIWIWKTDGTSEHRAVQVQKAASESFGTLGPALDRALSRLTETEVYYTGDGMVLRGTVRSLSEAARLQAILRSSHSNSAPGSKEPVGFDRIIDETVLAPELLARAKNQMDAWLSTTSRYGSRLRAEISDGQLVVSLSQGSVNGPAERSLMERKIQSIFPLTRIEIDALPDANPTVHFKVYLLELKKSHLRSLGLGWPAGQDGAFRVTPSSITSNLGLDVALQALESDGSAKILSNPELVVRAPGEAELFSGGEIPIHEQSAYFANVTWKTFGLTLKLSVAQSAGDRVRLDIFTEVSHLDPTLSVSDDKIPGIQSNRMKTQVDARYDKPLLLSGLLQQSMRKQVKGLPFLKDIPILGALFGSEDYLNERSELVAILLPSREAPPAPMEKVAHFFPTGPIPPRSRFPDVPAERVMREAPEYPWNVLR